MGQAKNIAIVFIVVFLFITYIVNKRVNEFLRNKTITLKIKKEYVEITFRDLIIKFFLIFSFFSIVVITVIMIIINLNYYFKDTESLDNIVVESQEKIQSQLDYYNEIVEKEYEIEKCKNPYIIEGFEYVEGAWNTGYVIKDQNGNEYVWVPCTNKENDYRIEILEKSNFSNEPFINKFDCNDEKYEEFLVSSLENGGFYISRFEIGKSEEAKPVSKKDYEIWTNISKEEAKKLMENMYTNINADLVNGYAYDTTLSWIINSEDVEISRKLEDDIYTGTKAYKNIYDILDNIYEITSEESYGEMIYRGFINTSKYVEINQNDDLDNRLSGSYDYKNEFLGFRIMLYK